MKRFALTILAVGATALVSSAAFAGPAPAITDSGNTLVHKTGGVYLEFGGPRYYGYDDYYYDRYPAYRSYGYYGPRRYYYGYDYDDYRPYKYSRRWVKERFEHPLGRR